MAEPGGHGAPLPPRQPLAALPLNAAAAPLAGAKHRPPSASAAPLDFTAYHTGWMDKQESAFKAWLNAVLQPVAVEGGEGEGGLAGRRLAARLRGLLWQLYSQDDELIRCMLAWQARPWQGDVTSGSGSAVHALVALALCSPFRCLLPRSVMLKVEQRIDGGQLKLKDEVHAAPCTTPLPALLACMSRPCIGPPAPSPMLHPIPPPSSKRRSW